MKVSDLDVIAFVEANAGAVGYVSEDAALGARVKALEVKEEGGRRHD